MWSHQSIDLTLPTFYLTVLIPLADVRPGDSTTEFIVGSHKVNLVASGIDNKERLIEWAEACRSQGKVHSVALKAGSICVFHGLTVHRGRAVDRLLQAQHAVTPAAAAAGEQGKNSSSWNMRPMIYGVFKKNWYEDEPDLSYSQV